MSGYDDDLAYIHDVGYGDYAAGAAPGVLRILRDAGIREGLVVDLGCGSGIWARRLVDAGYDVIGVDISPAMLAIARRRAPRATFHAASFLKFKPPRCRAVTSLGEVFNYLFDSRNGTDGRLRVCRTLFAALEPGGLLIFDVAEPGRGTNIGQSFRSGEDWTCLTKNEHDAERKMLTRHIMTFRRRGRHFRRGLHTHRLQLVHGKDVANVLRAIGFRVRLVRRWGAFDLPPAMAGLIARKP